MRARTLRTSVRLLWSIPLVVAGCSSMNGARPSHVPKLRTITSIGDRPTSIIAGVQGEEATASDDLTEAQLPPDVSISGRVVDERGRPVPQAEVRVALGDRAAGRVVRTRTDEAGGFSLHGLKPGASYRLIAENGDDRAPLVGQQEAEAGDRRVRIALRDLDRPAPKGRAGQIRPASEMAPPDEGPEADESGEPLVNEEDLPVPTGGLSPTARRGDRDEGELPPTLAARRPRWRRGGASEADAEDSDDGARLASGTREVEAEPADLPDEIERVNPLPPARERSRPRARSITTTEDDEPEDPLPPAREPGRMARRPSPPPRVQEDGAIPTVREPEDRLAADAPERVEEPGPFRGSRAPKRAEAAPTSPDLDPRTVPGRAATGPIIPADESNPLPPAREPAPTPGPIRPEPPPRVEEPPIPSEAPASANEGPLSTPRTPPVPNEPPVPTASPIEPPKVPGLPPDESGPDGSSVTEAASAGAEPAEAPDIEPGPKATPEPTPVVEPAPGPKIAEAETPSSVAPSADLKPEGVAPPSSEPAPDAPRPVREAPAASDPSPDDATPPTVEMAPSARARKRPTWGEVDSRFPPVMAIRNSRPAAKPVPSESDSRAERVPAGNTGRSPDRGRDGPFPRAECRYDALRKQVVDFRLPDLRGRLVRFQDLDADLVLIDFWGTWCGPCLETIPRLVELQSKFGPDRLKVVGIAYEQAASESVAAGVRSVAQRLGVNYAVLLGESDGRPCPLREALHVEGFPTMVLLDREGRILWRDMGSNRQTLDRLDSVIASNLARSNGAVRR